MVLIWSLFYTSPLIPYQYDNALQLSLSQVLKRQLAGQCRGGGGLIRDTKDL